MQTPEERKRLIQEGRYTELEPLGELVERDSLAGENFKAAVELVFSGATKV